MSRAALLTVFATGALVAPALSVAKGKPPTTG
jgi:hypothetical protein